jgi:hypothetical protein
MKKARILLALGIWVAFLPYLGFPYKFKQILFLATGLGIIYVGYIINKEAKAGQKNKEVFDNFSENIDFNESDNGKE